MGWFIFTAALSAGTYVTGWLKGHKKKEIEKW